MVRRFRPVTYPLLRVSNCVEEYFTMVNRKLLAGCSLLVPALLAVSACNRTGDEGTRARARETTPTRTTDFGTVRFVDAHHGTADLYFGDLKLFSGVDF